MNNEVTHLFGNCNSGDLAYSLVKEGDSWALGIHHVKVGYLGNVKLNKGNSDKHCINPTGAPELSAA